ncbi:MAG: hypothetical protein KF689_14400 [Gemmatimonadaceae bacterium]|nr:hypothetical protein [Gemmatimonadaceae bacterium]
MRFRALRPHRRPRLPSLVAGAVALLVQATLAVLVLWQPAPAPVEPARSPRAAEPTPRLIYIPTVRPRDSGPGDPTTPGGARGGTVGASTVDSSTTGVLDADAASSGAATAAPSPAAERPYGLFDNPFMPSRDARLAVPPLSESDSLQPLRDHLDRAFIKALARERAANAASDWTIGSGDARFGLTPGRLHLGHFTIPLPVTVRSLRDVDPRIRQQQAMLREVREQAERRDREARAQRP